VTEREAQGRPCREVLRSSLCESGCPLKKDPQQESAVTSFNVALEREGKETLPVCIVSSPLRNEAGETVGMVESIRDVRHVVRLMAEREAAVSQVERTTSWLASIVDTMSDAVIASDSQIRIVSFNRTAELLTGYGREEVLGRSCKEVFSSGFCPLEETLSAGSGMPGMDISIRVKDGRLVPVWITTELLRDSGGGVVGAVQLLRDRSAMTAAGDAAEGGYAPLVGVAAPMREVYQWIERLSHTDTTVLLQGESGTGKELVAELLHFRSARKNKPLIRVNCAALPESLLESELFGHTRGAFTGAVQDRTGRFELANQGTLFLDEIGDLPLNLQAKLLRVLQERTVERLGSGRPLPLDIRVIAATNRDLQAMIAAGTFREDLYYRLAVVPITLPPLRHHASDISLLAAEILRRLAARRGYSRLQLSPAALRQLCRHHWPGNVRELENALEFAAVRSRGGLIDAEDLPPTILIAPPAAAGPVRPESERDRITAALRSYGSAAEAASSLGLSRATLFRRMKQLGLSAGRQQSR
jgi:PAS domain S-box-containing protein